jgi:hypothetical protein
LQADLVRAIERDQRAVGAPLTGDPEPKKGLFSTRPDVTIANPVRPPARGRQDVEESLDRAAAGLRDGEVHAFERITGYATSELAYVHEIERTRAKVGDSDEQTSFALRVTTIWRLEGG